MKLCSYVLVVFGIWTNMPKFQGVRFIIWENNKFYKYFRPFATSFLLQSFNFLKINGISQVYRLMRWHGETGMGVNILVVPRSMMERRF